MSVDPVFVDTNLLLRYLTNDIPEQADAVESLLRQAEQGEIILATSSLVIVELVWTLGSFYKLSPGIIQSQVLAILNTPGLEVMDRDLLLQAAMWYVEKNVDFIDAYNVAWMVGQGIFEAFTFDRKHFSRFDVISVRKPGE